MLTEPLIEQQLASPDTSRQPFESRLGLMIQQELLARGNARLTQRLRWAKLPLQACLEDLDTRTPRGIDPGQLAQAFAHAACRADFSVRCFRLPRLVDELARYAAMQKRSALYRQLAKADLIVIDDFGVAPLADETVRDLLEILDYRYDRRSTLITSQLPIDQWHAYLGDRTVADAILDHLVHNSYRLVHKGDSMRKRRASATSGSSASKAKQR